MITADTTVLTFDGWKGYNNLSTNDLVSTLNRFNGEIEYQNPIEIIKDENFEGLLIHIQNRNINQLLTPDRRILLKKPYHRKKKRHWDSHWSFETAKALLKVVKTKGILNLPLAGKYKAGTRSIGNYYAELLGWIITDGDFVKDRRAVRITQSSVHPKKVDRIRFLLDQLNIKNSDHTNEYYSPTTKQMEVKHKFYLWVGDFTDRIRRIIPDKKPTYQLLQLIPSELISLFKGLLGGDSDLYAPSNRQKNGKLKNTCQFTQKDPRTRAWIQALCCLVGCRSKDSSDRVGICGRDTTEIRKFNVTIKRTRTPLKVWGVETENQTVVCRRTVYDTIKKGEKKGERILKSYVFITTGGT